MADRLTTRRGSTPGLWISKPGQNANTAAVDDLLFSTDTEMLQVVESGVFTGMAHGQSRDVSIPNLGFSPFVIAASARFTVTVSYPNATTVRLSVSNKSYLSLGNFSTDVCYAITSLPVA